MKKSTFIRRIGAMFAASVMTAAFCTANIAFAEEDTNPAPMSLNLTEATGVAGQLVTVSLVLNSGDLCTGYDVDVQFDSRLELKNVRGVFATETNDNVATLINLTGKSFRDNSPVSSLTFEIPADAEEGEVFDVNFSRIGKINSDDGDFAAPTATGTKITVLESAKTVTNHLVFVTEQNGVEVSVVGLRGDPDGDGKVGLFDSISVAQSIVNARSLDEAEAFFADVNQDQLVDLYDAIGILRYMISSDKSNAWETII